MARSLKKGPYIHPSVLKHLGRVRVGDKTVIKTWARSSTITPEMIGHRFAVHNGRVFIEFLVTEEMVGLPLGKSPQPRKLARQGGKMQKELEQKAQEAAKAAPAAPAT